MKSYVFPLEAVRKVRRHRLDLCEQILAYVMGQAQNLDRQRVTLLSQRERQLEELKAVSEEGIVDIDAAATRRYYAGRLLSDIAQIEHQRGIVEQQMSLCRQAVVKAEQELKVLDKIAEHREEEHRQQRERIDQIEREETWQAIHQVLGGA